MKLKLLAGLMVLGFVTLASSPVFATSASGTVAVTATVGSSVSLTFVSDPAGITLGGTGTSAATVAFGSVQAYGGVVPANVTKTVNGVINWTLSTPFDVVVQVANQIELQLHPDGATERGRCNEHLEDRRLDDHQRQCDNSDRHRCLWHHGIYPGLDDSV